MGYYFKVKVKKDIDKKTLLEECNIRNWGYKEKENYIKIACNYRNPIIFQGILIQNGINVISCKLKETDKKWVNKYNNSFTAYHAHNDLDGQGLIEDFNAYDEISQLIFPSNGIHCTDDIDEFKNSLRGLGPVASQVFMHKFLNSSDNYEEDELENSYF